LRFELPTCFSRSVKFDHIGGCAIVFKKPEMAFYYDIEEVKAAREAAKHAKTGQIQGFFRQVRNVEEKVAYRGPTFANEDEKDKTKPKAKAGLDGSICGMGVGAGRQLYPTSSSSSSRGPTGPLMKCVTIQVRIRQAFTTSLPLFLTAHSSNVDVGRTSAAYSSTRCQPR